MSGIPHCEPTYDAIIVGAGPAGSYAAAKLAATGRRVLLLDSRPHPGRKVCGEYLCPSAVALLRKDDLLETLTAGFPAIKGMRMAAPDSAPLSCHFPTHHQTHYGLAVNRQLFDQRLQDLARMRGAILLTGCRIQSITRVASGWQLQDAAGRWHHGRILIGADGRNSRVARELGLRAKTDNRRVALHCHVQSTTPNQRLGEMHVFSDGAYIGIDPTGDYELNLSLVCDAAIFKAFDSTAATFNHYLQQSTDLRARISPIPKEAQLSTVCPITQRVRKISGHDFALIGDAAGFLDPLTGEGMFQALWSATALSEELSRAGTSEEAAALRRYSRRKQRHFLQKSILNQLLQQLIRCPRLMRILAGFLRARPERADTFVGIIGNNYRPLEGLCKLITT